MYSALRVSNLVGGVVVGWGRGHKLVQIGQYWVTDRVNTIKMRHGRKVQSARSSENRPAPNEWNRLFCSMVNYSITCLEQEFDLSVSSWICSGSKKIRKESDSSTIVNSEPFSRHRTAGWARTSYCTAHVSVTTALQHTHFLWHELDQHWYGNCNYSTFSVWCPLHVTPVLFYNS